MRSGRFLFAIVVLALLAATGVRANLLENGDFTDWDNPTQPTHWIVEDTADALVNQSADPMRSTPYAVKLTRMVEGTGNNQGVKQQYVPVTTGQPYTLNAWFYDDDINAGGGIGISWYSTAGGETTYISHSGTVYTDSAIHTWQRLVKTDTAPATVALAKIPLRTYGFSGSPSGGIVYVDDAEFVEGLGAIEEGNRLIPNGIPGITVEPNPAPGRATIMFQLNRDGAVRLDIYDLTGSRRVMVHNGPMTAGNHTVAWNGRDDVGNQLPSGLYFAVLSDSAGNLRVCKLALNR